MNQPNVKLVDREWRRLGRVVAAPGSGYMMTHSMLPTPVKMSDHLRVYFTSCDREMRGRIFYAELESTYPFRLLHICREPVLDLGCSDNFDQDGVNPSQIVELNGRLSLYYIGWKRLSSAVPYTLLTGRASSTDGGHSFTRVSNDPLLLATESEPYFRTAPFVWREGRWQMVYIGGGEFVSERNGKRLPRYSLRHVSSEDGIDWSAPSRILLEPDSRRGEIGFGRPVVSCVKGRAAELMLSVRTVHGYTLRSCPFSLERGLDATLLKHVLTDAPSDWDSEMTCFGVPCEIDGGQLLLYNGNRFGETGFGMAWRCYNEGSHTSKPSSEHQLPSTIKGRLV